MTNQELVEWGNKSLQEPSSVFGTGEEWISKRKVATITKKNIEKSIKRQVVLEDGRVIEEDVPQVTRDTIEDTRTHENEFDEDKNILPNSDLNKIVERHWTPGEQILSEKQEQNINTQDMSEKTTVSASGYNMGDLRSSDLEKVLRQGRSVKSVVTPYENDQNSLSIPVYITSTSSHSNKRVDRENIHEIQRIHGDKLRTDRFVTHETAEDRGSESPAGDDSTEETESRDGDKRQFSRRKEERYIDYYKVPKGKAIHETNKIGRGIHMTSHDVDDRPVPTPRRDKSLGYEKRNAKPSDTRFHKYQDPRPSKPSESRLNNKRWSIASSSQEDAPSRVPYHYDRERQGKVKRSMSFQSKESPFLSNGLREKPRKSKSFLGSLKSLYSSVLLLPQHPKEHANYEQQRERIEKANKDWFDNRNYDHEFPGYENHPPQRPPRKYKSGQNLEHIPHEQIVKKPNKFQFISTSNFEMKSPYSTMERGRRHSRPKLEYIPRRDDSTSSHRSKNRSSPSRHHHHHHRESPSGSRHHSNRGSPNMARRHSNSRRSPSMSKHNGLRVPSHREPSPASRQASNRASPVGHRHHHHSNRGSPMGSRHHSNRGSPSSSLDRKYRASPSHHRSNRNSPISTLERSRKKRPTVVVPNIGTGIHQGSPSSSSDRNRMPTDYNTASLDRRKPEKKTHLTRLATDNYFSLDRKSHKKQNQYKDPRYPSSTLGRISKSLQNSFHRVGSSSPPRHPPPPPPSEPQVYHGMKRNSTDSSAGSVRISNNHNGGSGSGITRRQTFSTYDYNRETPRFEPERQQRRYGSRFFGQDDDAEVDIRDRPPPDMRRLLLNGVNESRRNAMNKEIEPKSIPIRAV